MNSSGKSTRKLETSPPAPARARSNEPVTRAVVLLNAAVASIAGLFNATGSALVTLIGFGLAALLTGWYLGTRAHSN